MRNIAAPVLAAALLAGIVAARAGEPPKDVGLSEDVRVSLLPLEITVWPKSGDAAECAGLTKDDFELTVDGQPRSIYAVDAVGTAETVSAAETAGGATVAAHARAGLSFVLYFDLWHIDTFAREFPACPLTKPLAFEQARRFVREEFRDGDQVLLVTGEAWPEIHYGWLRTRADALAALDRLERNPRVVAPRQEHLHHNDWIRGIESLYLALGRYPGRKDVLYLADDFRFDDVAMRVPEIVGRAQANGVVTSAVDLLSSCRNVMGPPCVDTGGGLACTPFRTPVALAPMSLDTGGRLFNTDEIATAAHELRAMQQCRYQVSFRKTPRDEKRTPSVRLALVGARAKRMTLFAPSSYETAAAAPKKKDTDEATFLLPRFGKGVVADAVLWPYHPSQKNDRWKVFVVARVERADDGPWPDDVTELTVSILVHRQSKVLGAATKHIKGRELASFAARRGTGAMLFPFEAIKPGETTVDVTVTATTEDVAATSRTTLSIPKPPVGGEAGPWYLSDGLERLGEDAVFAPSLDGVVPPGGTASIIGYGCPPPDEPLRYLAASLIPGSGDPPIEVPLMWLPRRESSPGACGWLAGVFRVPAAPGFWSFKPPASLSGPAGSDALSFTVSGAIKPAR